MADHGAITSALRLGFLLALSLGMGCGDEPAAQQDAALTDGGQGDGTAVDGSPSDGSVNTPCGLGAVSAACDCGGASVSSGYCCAGIPQSGACTIYYVSTSGLDGPGRGTTQTDPWQTLQYAEAHATAPGTIIALKKGDVWASTTAVAIKHGGSSGAHIIWDGSLWGTGANAIVRSSADRASGNDAIVNIIACSHVTFSHITVDGNDTQTFGLVVGGHTGFSGNNQSNETDIVIDGCSILNCGNGGDYRLGFLSQTWFTGMSDITIENSTLDGSDDELLSFYPGKSQDGSSPQEIKNITIRNNTLTNWGRRGQSTGYGMQINNKCTNVLVEHNTLTQGASGKGDAFHIESNEQALGYIPTGVIVRYNKMTVTRSNEWCVFIQQGQAKTADFYYNLFVQGNNPTDSNGGAVWIVISASPPYTGAVLNFWNNSIYTMSGISFQNDCGTPGVVTLKNNLIYNAGTNGDSSFCLRNNTAASTAHSNNAYYRSASASYLKVFDGTYDRTNGEVLSWEPTAQAGDPLLASPGTDFTLKAGSPCINAGVSVGLTMDYAGKPVGASPDIGALEY